MTDTVGLRQRLRIETRAAHDVLDETLDLIDRPIALDEYARLLCRLHGVHQAIEPTLAAQLDPALVAGRSKLFAIEHDLHASGSCLAHHAPSRCDLMPPITSLGAALGALYVIEGSTLGGRLIARSIQRTLEIPSDACGYFNIYGASTGARWQQVCNALDRLSNPEVDSAAIKTAKQVFNGMTTWLAPSNWRT